jgi:hypothetical protein
MKTDQEMPALWNLISSGEEFVRLPHEQAVRPEDSVFQTLRQRSVMSPADRLLWLEREDARLSKTLHRLTVLRVRYQEETRELRLSFTAEDRKKYERLKAVKPAEPQLRDSGSWAASL